MKIAAWGIGSHAQRNTLPALTKTPSVELTGMFSRNYELVQELVDQYECKAYKDDESMLSDPLVDAIYLATPTGLHFEHGKKILAANKHLFIEKSCASNLNEAQKLANLAEEKGLVIAECFMYQYHNQYTKLLELVRSGDFGLIRQVQTRFGFPHLDPKNVRYKNELGGGALLDAGGYTLSMVPVIAENEYKLVAAELTVQKSYEVDTDGVAFFMLDNTIPFIASWGIGRHYRNEIEIWTENGTLLATRFFSKPEQLEAEIKIFRQGEELVTKCSPENHFVSMFNYFVEATLCPTKRLELNATLIRQAELLQSIHDASTRIR